MASNTIAEIFHRDFVDLDGSEPHQALITDVKHLASYTWIEAKTPTIAVPGSPPLWTPPSAPRRLEKDSGHVYIAQNAARRPESPLEPLFRALYKTNPAFDIRSVDIVTDRNNIRKLLSFVDRNPARGGLEAFTINVEIAGDTTIFSRTEVKTSEVIGPREFRGFGREFEKAYTTNQIRRGTGHHRIISYQFGGLSFIIRHETDGYVVDAATRTTSSQEPGKDALADLLGSLSLTPAEHTPHNTIAGSKLTIKEDGDVVPLASTLEIKTRVSHMELSIQGVAAQLWVSQTPKLVRAYHHKGVFEVPEVEDVAAEIRQWEKAKQKQLKRLAALLHKIISAVKGAGGKAVIKYDETHDKLVLRKSDAKKMLPDDLYSKWNDTDKGKTEVKADSRQGPEGAGKLVKDVEAKAKGKASKAKGKAQAPKK